MRPVTAVYVGVSLDGLIAREDGRLDWLERKSAEEADLLMARFATFLATVSGIVMGRATFEQVLGFDPWPYGALPVTVLSATWTALPPGTPPTVSLRNLAPDALLDALGALGHRRSYIDGGKTIQGFLRADLVDEITIATLPILLGSGRRLFGVVPDDRRFAHLGTEVFPSGVVQSRYARVR